MKKIIAVVFVLILSMAGSSIAQKKEFRFGIALQTLQNPWMLSLKDGAESAASIYGNVKLFVVGAEHSTDLSTQVKQVEDFIQMKLDAIGLFAIERKGILPVMEKVNRAGIPIITLGTDSDGGKRECLIATDEVLGGKLGAEWITRALYGKGKVAILEGSPGSQSNVLRVEGFRNEIQKAKGIQIVSSLTARFRRDEGMRVMSEILTAHPDLNAVMAVNDEMALGALETLRARGKLKQVKLVGYNGAAEALHQVYHGNMAADVLQYPERMGELFVEWAVKLCQGEKLPADLPKTQTTPPTIHIDSGVGIVDTTMLQIKVGPALKVIQNDIKYYMGKKPI